MAACWGSVRAARFPARKSTIEARPQVAIYRIHKRRHAQSHTSRLCNHQRSDTKFHGRPRSVARRKRDPRQCGRPGTDLDPVAEFGKNVPMKRPGQPAELATAFVMLADPLSSYISGATIAVTGGKPLL